MFGRVSLWYLLTPRINIPVIIGPYSTDLIPKTQTPFSLQTPIQVIHTLRYPLIRYVGLNVTTRSPLFPTRLLPGPTRAPLTQAAAFSS